MTTMNDFASWSEEAYSIAVQMRTPKTLLVEGKRDKGLFERIFIEEGLPSSRVVIDTAEIFRGQEYRCQGNKVKILNYLESTRGDVRLSGKLIAFYDREWDGLSEDAQGDLEWVDRTKISDAEYHTLGHSIENYLFVASFFKDYTKHYGEGLYSEDIGRKIDERFPEFLALAEALSSVARLQGNLNRCQGLMKLEYVNLQDQACFSRSFGCEAAKRGIANVKDFLEKVHARAVDNLRTLRPNMHHLCHGHLGEETLWCCVAALILQTGADELRCSDLAFGRKDERSRFFYGWLHQQSAMVRRPIDDILRFVF